MITTLCFDFGNTRLKCAVFRDAQMETLRVLPNDEPATIETLLQEYRPQKTILSSVVVHHPELERLLAAHSSFHLLSHQSQLPFTVPVGKPETVGADRLAYCSASCFFYPKQNNLVIATGSCITYNFINQEHEFLGGGISPGMEMRFKSLQYYTAKLPLIAPEPIVPLIGYDTKTNILSGVIRGMAMEIDGMIGAYAAAFGNFNAILTGGDTAYFAPHLKNKIFADSNFIYKGLYAISELNNS